MGWVHSHGLYAVAALLSLPRKARASARASARESARERARGRGEGRGRERGSNSVPVFDLVGLGVGVGVDACLYIHITYTPIIPIYRYSCIYRYNLFI